MSQPQNPRLPIVVVATGVGALLLGFLLFWSGRSSGDVREWTPVDHDQPVGAQSPQTRAKSGQPKGQGQDGPNLAEVAWTQRCAPCHGEGGRGDGPQAAMVRAPDLTRPDWLQRVTDDDLRDTIRKGRNKMPAFDLPPAVLQGIVQRIRARGAGR